MNAERTCRVLQRFRDGEVVTYSVRPDIDDAQWTHHAGVLKVENGAYRMLFDEEEVEEMYDLYDLQRPNCDHVDIPVDGFVYQGLKTADAYKTAVLQKQVSELSKVVSTTIARVPAQPQAKTEDFPQRAAIGEKRKRGDDDIPEEAGDDDTDSWWMPLPRNKAWPAGVEVWFGRVCHDVGGLIRDLQAIYFDSEQARKSEAMKENFNALCHLLQGRYADL